MSDERDYLFDKAGEPDPDVAELEAVLGTQKYAPPGQNRVDRVHDAPLSIAPASRPGMPARPRRILPILAPLAVAAAVVLALVWRKSDEAARPALDVTSVEGTSRIDARALGPRGRLAIGAWLETDEGARADIALREIGHVTVEPGSRLRVATLAANEQRLELTRGAIEAQVRAMPRLFVVDTPSARATDLGCAYRLEVVPNRGTFLHVTSGAVELAGHGRQAHVPAGASCETRPERGPGSPYFDDAADDFKAALRRFDFDDARDANVVDTLVGLARVRDTLTLWQIVWRFDATKENQLAERQRVIARVFELVPPPAWIDIGSGSPEAFQKYQDTLVTHW